MFQYSQAVLAALLTLPKDRFDLIVAYTDPAWNGHIPSEKVRRLPLGKSIVSASLAKLWVFSGCSFDVWYRWSTQFHPIVKTIVRQNCDLWVFPRQDVWSSQFPVPSLAAVHDLMHRYESKFPEVSLLGRKQYRDRYLRQSCGWARGILVDSQLGKRHVHESYGAPVEKIFVLPYIPPRYIFENCPSKDFATKYWLPRKYLLYPAQFWEHKNHARLFEAVSKVKMRLPDIRLVLVGSLENRHRALSQTVEDLGLRDHVIFLGQVSDCDMPELYRRARALIFPTFFGPTNIPPLEAFAVGCPVATSRIYAMPEQVGDAALLFDPNSVEEIADSIRRLWSDEDLCQLLIAKGKAKAATWGQAQFDRCMQNIVTELVRA